MEYNKETKTLSISYKFNEELKDIPKDTEVIIFEEDAYNDVFSKFNKKVDNLPQSLTHLTFRYYFNQKVNNLPKNLTHLTFDSCFNQKVDNLPKNITHLTFGWGFNQKVDNLPQSLTHLTFTVLFNQKVDKLPQSLTHLTIGSLFKEDSLPKNLTYLTYLTYLNLGVRIQNEIILPQKLKELSLTCNNALINNLPEHIEKLYVKFFNNKKFYKKVENLPPTLKEIIIEDEKFKEYIKIPFGCILTIKKIE